MTPLLQKAQLIDLQKHKIYTFGEGGASFSKVVTVEDLVAVLFNTTQKFPVTIHLTAWPCTQAVSIHRTWVYGCDGKQGGKVLSLIIG